VQEIVKHGMKVAGKYSEPLNKGRLIQRAPYVKINRAELYSFGVSLYLHCG
jgi:hypothetical protein